MYIYIYIYIYMYVYIYIYIYIYCCKKLQLVPNGLRLKNPFRHHPDNYVSQAIIDKASAKLSNIALHKAYVKQRRLSTLLDSSSLHINEIINEPSLKTEAFVFFNKLLNKKTFILLCHKNKKQQQLIRNSPLHSSLQDQEIIPDFSTNNQPSMHFIKQAKISTVFSLSNIKLSATQSSPLEKGIYFCPTHKLDLVKLCHDINEYTSLLRNKEFFSFRKFFRHVKPINEPFQNSLKLDSTTWTQ